jgi:hypothetical protein
MKILRTTSVTNFTIAFMINMVNLFAAITSVHMSAAITLFAKVSSVLSLLWLRECAGSVFAVWTLSGVFTDSQCYRHVFEKYAIFC